MFFYVTLASVLKVACKRIGVFFTSLFRRKCEYIIKSFYLMKKLNCSNFSITWKILITFGFLPFHGFVNNVIDFC